MQSVQAGLEVSCSRLRHTLLSVVCREGLLAQQGSGEGQHKPYQSPEGTWWTRDSFWEGPTELPVGLCCMSGGVRGAEVPIRLFGKLDKCRFLPHLGRLESESLSGERASQCPGICILTTIQKSI